MQQSKRKKISHKEDNFLNTRLNTDNLKTEKVRGAMKSRRARWEVGGGSKLKLKEDSTLFRKFCCNG